MERLSHFEKRNSNQSRSPDRRDSSQVADRKSIKSLRMSYIAARGSLTSARQSRQSLMPVSAGKAKQRKEARETQTHIAEQAKRIGSEPPPYDFLEMCGKGAYGRVFKG